MSAAAIHSILDDSLWGGGMSHSRSRQVRSFFLTVTVVLNSYQEYLLHGLPAAGYPTVVDLQSCLLW